MTSEIKIQVTLDDEKMPDDIKWTAPGGGVEEPQNAKALFLGLWDGEEKSAMRIDLWVSKMGIDEMNDFVYQSIFGMAETYVRATNNKALGDEMKFFAKNFLTKASNDTAHS